jgi:acetyltransferase-like isoleucine patch superfamily enzyme
MLRFASLMVASLWTNVRLRAAGIGGGLVTCQGPPPIVVSGGRVTIGQRLALRGTQARVELGAAAGASLTIGDRVFINGGATLVAKRSITIGDGARIGDFVAILDSDYHPVDQVTPVRTAAVHIGVNVWLGRAAIVLPGVTIGDHAVIAAGSIVTADVPARVLVAGVPARPVRPLVAEDGWRRD